jgi:hypothetical protein
MSLPSSSCDIAIIVVLNLEEISPPPKPFKSRDRSKCYYGLITAFTILGQDVLKASIGG